MMDRLWKTVLRAAGAAVAAIGFAACGAASDLREIPKDALVVDVRTPGEYAEEHFPGAVNIPVDQIGRRAAELGDKDRPVVVYCRSGHRSASAKRELVRQGFTRVSDGGGLQAMMALAPKSP